MVHGSYHFVVFGQGYLKRKVQLDLDVIIVFVHELYLWHITNTFAWNKYFLI